MAGRVDSYIAMAGQARRHFQNFCFFYLAALTASFTREREREKRAANSSTRKREREKKSEKGSFETCLVSLFSQLLSSFFAIGSPPILALLVSSRAPSSNYNTNRTTIVTKRNSRTQNKKKIVAFNIKQQRRFFLELNCKEGMNM
jgi:hypothetical protein